MLLNTTTYDQTISRRSLLKCTAVGTAAIAGSVLSTSAPAMPRATKIQRRNPLATPVTVTVEVKEGGSVDLSHLPRVRQKLAAPPFAPVHEQVASGGPKIVEVRLEIEEKLMVVDEDNEAEIWALTFGGSVPGPLIVVHQDDYVELTLVNPKSSNFEHNVDFHASTGALGGAGLTLVLPGEEAVIRWRATKPGVFVYHCAPGGDMTPYHVCHGMNGAVLVLPREGLKDKEGNPLRYDDLVYVGEQDYYLPKNSDGEFTKYESAGGDYSDSIEAMRTLIPTHCVFNGGVGALTGENALRSSVGRTVLIIHAQANRDTRPHLIGGHADYVWSGGSFGEAPQTGIETWFVAGGSAGAAMYTFKQPGTYAYVNHNLIEAVLLGAVAHFVVDGDWNDDLMAQITKPRTISQ